MKEIELRPDPPMVVRPCALQPLEVRLEVLLREERRPVDPRQLRVVLVATPVRAGEPGQLERLDRARVLQVRPAAEIGEVALRVERDRPVRGVDQLRLVRLALCVEASPRSLAIDLDTLPGTSLRELALDLRLDRGEIVLADRLRELEVVVEPVLDRRPDRDLDSWVETTDSLGEQMRGRVAEDCKRVGVVSIARRQELEPCSRGKRKPQVAHLAVDPREHCLLRELRPDRASRVECARALGQLELGTVGKAHVHAREDSRGIWVCPSVPQGTDARETLSPSHR